MLSLAIAFSGLLFTTNSILQSFGRTTQPVIDMAVGGVVKVALSYVLIGIPQVAAMGSAISTVASYVVMVVLNLIAIRSSLPRMDSVVRTALPLLLSAGVMGGGELRLLLAAGSVHQPPPGGDPRHFAGHCGVRGVRGAV